MDASDFSSPHRLFQIFPVPAMSPLLEACAAKKCSLSWVQLGAVEHTGSIEFNLKPVNTITACPKLYSCWTSSRKFSWVDPDPRFPRNFLFNLGSWVQPTERKV